MIRSGPVLLISLCLLSSCVAAPASSVPEERSPVSPTPGCVLSGTAQKLRLEPDIELGVYLPPCYDARSSDLYPVLYLLPGVGGMSQDWFEVGLAAAADHSILSGEVPPFLIVTTDNTYDFITLDTILVKIIPYIESHYRVDPERRYRAVAGGSLGGASAYLLAFQHPDLFASAGVFGNGLIFGQEEMIRGWLSAIPVGLKPRVLLNSGESDTFMLQQARALIPLLDEAGIAHTEIFSPGVHSYTYWITNFPAYFRWLAEDWQKSAPAANQH